MARIIRTSYAVIDKSVVDEAIGTIRRCGLVVAATDTLYGILADPYRDECVDRIYSVKKRTGKPIPLLADSIDSIIEHVDIDEKVERLLEALWPGPVTVVLEIRRDSSISEKVHLGSYKVGFRIPASPLVREIARGIGGLVTGTSANISGLEPARSLGEAYRQLGGSIDLYIDSGLAPLGIGSTVINLVDGYSVLRDGAVSRDTVDKYYRRFIV